MLRRVATLIFFTFAMCHHIMAQSIEGSRVNAGTGDIESSTNLSYSLGDLFVGTMSAGTTELISWPFSEQPVMILGAEPSEGTLSAYPNPTTSILNIQTLVKEISEVQVFDLKGTLLIEHKSSISEVDFSDLPEGLYMLHVNYKGGNKPDILRIIKKQP